MSTITTASQQWFSRPEDQRFLSLTEMSAYKRSVRENARAQVVSNRKLQVAPVEGDSKGLLITDPNGHSRFSHWSFGQLCSRVGAPAGYLRSIPTELTADLLNYGLVSRDVEDIGILLHDDSNPWERSLAAATGPNYGRIWDTQIIDALVERFGDGVTGQFRVPGEFGQAVEVNRSNTTLYASDRDMFVFLADEVNRIEVPDRRNGQSGSLARGFFVWNSEVGSTTFGIATFLFDYVCMNRIVWGAEEYKEIKIRHTTGAPDKWVEEVAPALISYANSSTRSIDEAIANAKAKRLEDDVTDFLLNRRFTRNQAAAISLAHLQDEGRPIETIWDAVTGITAYAREIPHQDVRVGFEREAGKVLRMAS